MFMNHIEKFNTLLQSVKFSHHGHHLNTYLHYHGGHAGHGGQGGRNSCRVFSQLSAGGGDVFSPSHACLPTAHLLLVFAGQYVDFSSAGTAVLEF